MRRVVAATGRVLVTVGILILLLVAYQLWGTGIYEARQQSKLKHQFTSELRREATATTTTAASAPPVSTTTTTTLPPPGGDAIAILRIPKIGVNSAVVQGIERPDLRKGPGHYPLTPMPGQIGNAAIAGHRTTYGAPFYRLDELHEGDDVSIRTPAGTYHYRVTEQLIVRPTDVAVLDPTRATATLTLTTCNPRYSARQRLVVHATLVVAKSPPPAPAPPPGAVQRAAARLSSAGLSGEGESRLLTLWWGLAAAVVGASWWLLFHRHPRWTTWFIGVAPFLVVVFFFYSHLDRLLPANY